MKTMKILIAAAAASAFIAPAAHAATLTFSTIPNGSYSASTYTEAGVTVTAVNANPYFFGFPTAGQLHLDVNSGNSAYDFTFTDGSLFDLASLDVSFASGNAIGTFTAFNALNTAIGTAIVDASTTGSRTFNLTGISRLRLVDTGSHFSIDNLVLNASTGAVPEPATWAMMLLGFGGIGFGMRRRKNKVATTVSYA